MPGAHEPLTDQLLDGSFPHEDPYPLYATLRADAPVAWNATKGFWAASRMAEVLAVSTDPATYRSGAGILVMEIGTTYDSPPTMMHTDPPEHTAYRKLVQPPFGRRMVTYMDQAVRRRAVNLIEALPLGEDVDVVQALSIPFPIQVIADLLGLPDDDVPRMFEWSEASIPGATDWPEEKVAEVQMDMWMTLVGTAAERRSHPQDDLISLVALAEVDGRRLSDDEIAMFLIQLLVAGNETTRNNLSGGLVALSQHPDQWERLRQDPSLVPSATEELLRWTTPVISFMRTATRDVVLGGQDIAAGDPVLMLYASADRDRETFGPTADQLDVARDPNPHMAFGFGAHFCLGAALARLEGRVVLEELLSRVSTIEPAGPVARSPSTVIAGVKSAPLRLTPR